MLSLVTELVTEQAADPTVPEQLFEWAQFIMLPIILALIGRASFKANKTAKSTKAEITTNNGKRAGEYLESIYESINELKVDIAVNSERTDNKIDRMHSTFAAHANLDAETIETLAKILQPESEVTADDVASLRALAVAFRRQS